jgi:hypothetical protein
MTVLLFVAALLAACAPSNAEVRRAKAAEYAPDQYAAVFEACKQALIESEYQIEVEDKQRGILVSSWRMYSPEGMAENKDRPRVQNGSALFRIGVELAKGPHGGIIVHVDGGAQGYVTGSPVLRNFKHDDPQEPTWVEGKIDNLVFGIHEKLAQFELKAAVATTK